MNDIFTLKLNTHHDFVLFGVRFQIFSQNISEQIRRMKDNEDCSLWGNIESNEYEDVHFLSKILVFPHFILDLFNNQRWRMHKKSLLDVLIMVIMTSIDWCNFTTHHDLIAFLPTVLSKCKS